MATFSGVLVVVCFLAVFLSSAGASDASASVEFDVKPGGEVQTVDKVAHGMRCIFTFACQGGTKEEWTFTLKRSKDKKKILCEVERPDGKSYLFFHQFKLELEGAKVKSAKAFKELEVPLANDEFTSDSTSISHIDGNFKSQLTRVRLAGSIQTFSNDEL